MKIECIPSDSRRSVMMIICDGEPWKEVHTAIFGSRPALPQGSLSVEEFERQFHELECAMAKKYALKRLTVQAMLSTRLARSLEERLVSQPAIEKVIGELTALKLLDDAEWAASYVRVQSARRVGPRAIAQKLAAKGVSGPHAAKFLENVRRSDGQKSMILHLLQTRYSKRDLNDHREKQKVIASLARRGFDLDAILACV